MRPYVRKVVSNFKGGVDAELGYRTLVLGPNGTGKSAITTSIEYALSGKVSDVVGRATVADVNQLLTLGPGDSIFAEATLSDNSIVRCETKGKKSTSALHPTAFPLREVRDALSGNVETVRKFFLRMTSGAVSRADVENQIPGPHRELFGQVIAPTRADTPAVDLLLYALEKAKARARELAAEAKAAGSVAAETTAGLVPVAESDLENARESLARARVEVQELTSALNRARQVASLVADEGTARARMLECGKQLGSIPPPAEADRVREELWELLRYAESKALGSCPCCRQAVPPPPEGVYRSNAGFFAERLVSVEAKRTERAKELERYNAARAALDIAERSHVQAVARLDALGLTESPPCIPEIESRLLQAGADADQIEHETIQLERAAATWEQARRSRDAAAEREIQATKWAQLADACATAVGTLMDTAVVAFNAKVQKYLPAGDVFALQLRDGEREVCRYGFLREKDQNDIYRRLDIALSGAEWARLCSALAAAFVEGESEALRVVIPDDRSWDSRTLVTVLEALSTAPAQVIVATTTEPARIPDGWTVIRTEGETQREVWQVEIETQQLKAPPATNVPRPPEKIAPCIVTTNLVTPLDSADDLSDVKVEKSVGDYIAMGSCGHGVSQGEYCVQCKEAREATEAAQRKAREEKDRALTEKRTEIATTPRETLATTDLVSVAGAKRGRGRPKGSKNKPKGDVQTFARNMGSDASVEAELAPAVSQDPGTTAPTEPAPELVPTSSDPGIDLE